MLYYTTQQLIDVLVQLDSTIRQTAAKEPRAKKKQFLELLAKIGHAGAALTLGDSYNPALSQTSSFSNPDKSLALYYYQMAIEQSAYLFAEPAFNYPHAHEGQQDYIKCARERLSSLRQPANTEQPEVNFTDLLRGMCKGST
jgi:hypothetical protein